MACFGSACSLVLSIDWIAKRGRSLITSPVPKTNNLSRGGELTAIFKDAAGYVWIGGIGGGLDRFDERTSQFKHYRHNPADPNSLMTDDVVSIHGDSTGLMWVGQFGGAARFDPQTGRFTNYPPGPVG